MVNEDISSDYYDRRAMQALQLWVMFIIVSVINNGTIFFAMEVDLCD